MAASIFCIVSHIAFSLALLHTLSPCHTRSLSLSIFPSPSRTLLRTLSLTLSLSLSRTLSLLLSLNLSRSLTRSRSRSRSNSRSRPPSHSRSRTPLPLAPTRTHTHTRPLALHLVHGARSCALAHSLALSQAHVLFLSPSIASSLSLSFSRLRSRALTLLTRKSESARALLRSCFLRKSKRALALSHFLICVLQCVAICVAVRFSVLQCEASALLLFGIYSFSLALSRTCAFALAHPCANSLSLLRSLALSQLYD